MLERTAGCLESGSLRRLLPRATKSLKSRRMLQSAFWNHGAMGLELSPFSNTLISMRDAFNGHNESNSRSTIPVPTGAFLGFLYPLGALSLIQQYSLWNHDKLEAQPRRSHARFRHLGQRLFTSLAAEASLPQSATGLAENLAGSQVEHSSDTLSVADWTPSNLAGVVRRSLVGAGIQDDYDEAWRQFELSKVEDRWQLIPHLLAYLSTSDRRIDAQRSIQAFSQIHGIAEPPEYESAIRSYLLLGTVGDAIRLHDQAMRRLGKPVYSDMLLAHLLKMSHWHLACDVWNDYQHFRNAQPSLSYNIWKTVDGLPNLSEHALELRVFVDKEMGQSLRKNWPEARTFASMLANRALLAMSKTSNVETFTVMALLKVLQRYNADTPERYEILISSFMRYGHTRVAIQCYREYRQRTRTKISRPILDKVLNVVCTYHSTVGMQQVLDDWYRFYGSPSAATYRKFMSEFATHGDAVTVKALFDQYIAKFISGPKRQLKTPDDLAPLLHVHAKCGELSKVLEIFHGMEDEFGVKPNLNCWNILINAYGRAGEVDGAFYQFRKLLQSPIRPDSYTFGTLMGICITRGDLEQAKELYRMAETAGVDRTIAMVDCLVLGHIQDGHLLEAEQICEEALGMDFKDPLTRTWNYLLTAYAMCCDLHNTNRILRRMKDTGIKFNAHTYAALMHALAMVKQPDRAAKILHIVMPEAGMRATSLHYTIVMGGYIATGELRKVFRLHSQMLERNIKQSISTWLMTLKYAALDDQRLLQIGSQEVLLSEAEQYFYEAYNSMDAQDNIDPKRKGTGRGSLDSAYSVYFDYLIFVYGQHKAFNKTKRLCVRFLGNSPKKKGGEPPLMISSALMIASLKAKDHRGVQQSWGLVFRHARKLCQSIKKLEPAQRLALTVPLSIQMKSLGRQRKFAQLAKTVANVEAAGFLLDNKNWNLYIQLLTKAFKYKQAFELCESKLMNGWTGWARLPWTQPRDSRLEIEMPNRRKNRLMYLEPVHHTLLYLAKVYSELRKSAAETNNGATLLRDLEKSCPKTVHAVKTMPRMDDDLEREVFKGP